MAVKTKARLILSVDDYGLCDAVNEGIRRCVKKGLISSVHVLANLVTERELDKLKIAVAHCNKYMKINCGISLHFNTSDGPALSIEGKSKMTDKDGNFLPLGSLNIKDFDRDLMRQEFCAQRDRLAEMLGGYDQIDAVSSHNNLHIFLQAPLMILLDETRQHEIPYRSPIQWQHKTQIIKTDKLEKWMPVMTEGLAVGLKFWNEPKTLTQLLCSTIIKKEKLYDQRERILATGSPSPHNCFSNFFGQPNYDILKWLVDNMESHQLRMDDAIEKPEHRDRFEYPDGSGVPLVTEIFTHLAVGQQGPIGFDLRYSMIERNAEYHTMYQKKTQDLVKMVREGKRDVQICSYRDAFKGWRERTPFIDENLIADLEAEVNTF